MVMCWGLKCKGEWGSDKGLCPLCSGHEGSFVTVKLDPPPFLGGVPLSRYTRAQVWSAYMTIKSSPWLSYCKETNPPRMAPGAPLPWK